MPCSIPAERLLMLSELLSSILAAVPTRYDCYSALLYTGCKCYNHPKPGKMTIKTTITITPSAASSLELFWASSVPRFLV